MDKTKKAYFAAIRRLITLLLVNGRQTVEVPLFEESNSRTIEEFKTEVGVQYEYTIIHRGQVRIRSKA